MNNHDVFARHAIRHGDFTLGTMLVVERVARLDVVRPTPAPDAHARRLDWHDRALCRAPDAPDMTGTIRGRNARHDPRPAFCRPCPVREQCLAYALDYEGNGRFRYGVFGGRTPSQRTDDPPRTEPRNEGT